MNRFCKERRFHARTVSLLLYTDRNNYIKITGLMLSVVQVVNNMPVAITLNLGAAQSSTPMVPCTKRRLLGRFASKINQISFYLFIL